MKWWSSVIQGGYPPAAIFDHEGPITRAELLRFARIIMTEGVPYACHDFPMAFEFARGRAAERLAIHPKQISLVGSARIGYSLATSKFGTPFDLLKSDIDLFAVAAELFASVAREHGLFIAAWRSGEIAPRHPLQESYWQSSERHDPFNIHRGFLDANHIPAFDRFPVARGLSEAAYLFHTNLEAKAGKRIGRKASIRVYRDWECALRQIAFTLEGALAERNFKISG